VPQYLIVAHQTAASPELRDAIAALLREAPDARFTVLVPATPVQHMFTWEDGETLAVAEERAGAAQAAITDLGGEVVRVAIGSRNPIMAIADEVREHPGYDAIVIGTFPPGASRWLRLDLVSQSRRRFAAPIIHVVARPAGRPRPETAGELPDARYRDPRPAEIDGLVALMRSDDGLDRRRARHGLVQLGRRAAQAVVPLLADGRESVRWEAARALVDVHHPDAIPALVPVLGDPVRDVRWLAAEALIAHGPDSVVPVLRYLLAHAGNDDVVPAAHHVIRSFSRGEWEPILRPVVDGLEDGASSVSWLVPSERALRALTEVPATAVG
jgi:hypothetical protein